MKVSLISVLPKLERPWDLSRTWLKTLTWRAVGSTSTFLISYLITGMVVVSSTIAIVQVIANTVLYYIHETIWNRVE
jgi:uncharacterized membrane protein